MEYICSFRNLSGVEQAIENISASADTSVEASSERENERRMDMLYDRIIASINEHSQRKYAFRVISWVAYAGRTLNTKELLTAISIDAGQHELNDGDVYELDDLIDICNGLVVTDEFNGTVRLVHFSARNYLDRHEIIRNDVGEVYRAMACLTYLSLDMFKACRAEVEMEFPFLDYAATNLTSHLSKISDRFDSNIIETIVKLVDDPGFRQSYIRAKLPPREQSDMPLLNVACEIGYEGAVAYLLTRASVNINSEDSLLRRPLSWAVERHNKPVVQVLLDSGAEVNFKYRVSRPSGPVLYWCLMYR